MAKTIYLPTQKRGHNPSTATLFMKPMVQLSLLESHHVKSLNRDDGILSCPGPCLNAGPDLNILNVRVPGESPNPAPGMRYRSLLSIAC